MVSKAIHKSGRRTGWPLVAQATHHLEIFKQGNVAAALTDRKVVGVVDVDVATLVDAVDGRA